MGPAAVTSVGWVGFVAAVALGTWLIVRRNQWARDVYQPPLSAMGRAGPIIPAALGVLVIIAAVWAVASDL